MSDLEMSGALDGIAIIGMAGRFPKAKDLDEFWRILRDGVETTSFFSDEELKDAGVEDDRLKQPDYVKARAILEKAEWFDGSFFDLSPREAEIIDPQHRLFLECAWETLENAGYDPEAYEGLVGVYAGASMNTYLLHNLASNPELLALIGDYQTMLGNDKDFLTTRVSYKLNLKGPSVNVQSACSTSLVAVAMACQSLLSYQCDIALAGGVSVMFPQKAGYVYREGGIHSPDGRCRAFDSKGQGMFAGQGVGIVALKRLEDALADRDHIHAVVRGSAVNNDGSLKVGYTAPSVDGQAVVIRMAQALADVDPETISYVEAHGTATPLGDPIEIAGLAQAFGNGEKNSCAIGSVKTNIGHLDAAAGVAGLIKTVLALEHKMIPPSLHFETPNPKIDFDSTPFYVNTSLSPWPTDGAPRRAGVSSFGIGGTNAHVVLEEAPAIPSGESQRSWHVLPLSARSEAALQAVTENLAAHLGYNPALNLADVAHTLQVGRRAFNHRRIVVCADIGDAIQSLETLDPERVFTYRYEAKSTAPPVAFMFTGQGAQYVNMGLELYQTEAVFREQVDFCAEFLKPHLGLDLRDLLYPGRSLSEEEAETAAHRLRQTNITQPALFVIEYALAKLWMAFGVEPQAMIGHSIGEYVAACLAGVFSLEEALLLVAARGRLMRQMPPGAMMVVPLAEEEILPLLPEALSLAVINGPSLCVVSGPAEAVDDWQAQLEEKGVDCRRLRTSHAFHSPMMDAALAPFRAQVEQIALQPPQIPFLSNVSGAWITAAEATDPGYWVNHLRRTVRFGAGIEELLEEPDRVLLEVGPGRTLSSLVQQHSAKAGRQVTLTSLRHPRERHSDVMFFLATMGRLWLSGVAVDWSQWYGDERRRRVPLPTYPFERQRYWVEPRKRPYQAGTAPDTLAKRPDIADWFYVPSWEKEALPQPTGELNLREEERMTWLVFLDNWGAGSRIVEKLQEQGQAVVSAQRGSEFRRVNEISYMLDHRSSEDYEALFEALEAAEKLPDKIVHLWSVIPEEVGASAPQAKRDVHYLGFYSLLYLAQAMGKRRITRPIEIGVVTNDLQPVSDEAVLHPERATILGPCRVIPKEYPNITCRALDISLPQSGNGRVDELPDQLLTEMIAASSDELVAYRGGDRWVQTFAHVPLDESSAKAKELREEGVYLITGGLGGVGLALAEHLAKTVRARLVLTGRSALPPCEEWPQLIQSPDGQERVVQKIRKVKALEELGAEVMVASADAADLAQMEAVIASARERFGAIHGVIHAAGIPGGGMIQLKTTEMAEAVLAPKVAGTLVLDAVLADTELDLFLLCSSINSILPAFGQIDYCGANAFLDIFAHHYNNKNGAVCLSVNWDTWQEVGMAVNTDVPAQLKRHREENLRNGLSTREGQEVFNRIVGHPASQILVSTRDFDVLSRRQGGLQTGNLLEELERSSIVDMDYAEPPRPASVHARPNLQTAYVAPRNRIEQKLAETWQELLGVDRVGIHDNFFELGGSSLLALRLFNQIEKGLDQKLPLATLFEATTIAQLTELMDIQEKRKPSWSSLVPIQTGGSKPPFFFIHAAGGHVLVYRDIARHLGPDQPVYGLQSRGMNGEETLLTRIEDMAQVYLEEIQAVQPEGPYLLGGYCMGGTVALDIAQKLQAQGQEVKLLALFETYNWANIKSQSLLDFAYFYWQKIGFHWRNFVLLNTKEKRIFLMEKLKIVRHRTRVWYGIVTSRLGGKREGDDQPGLRPGQLWDTNDQAALNYKPAPYPGKITHFRPVKEYARHQGPDLNWDNLAGEGVDTHELSVYPAAMLVEPFVEQTAEILKECIDKALAERQEGLQEETAVSPPVT